MNILFIILIYFALNIANIFSNISFNDISSLLICAHRRILLSIINVLFKVG